MTTTHKKGRPGASGATKKSNGYQTQTTLHILPCPPLAVIDCTCGHPHHVPDGVLGALGDGCKPLLVGVRR